MKLEDILAGQATGRRGARVHFHGFGQAYTLGRRRHPRAFSSPSRSGCRSYSPGSRPRSPSVCRSPPPLPVQPVLTCVTAAGESLCGFGGFAYFSPQPPPAPLWLVPLPAPRVTPVVASFNIQTSSVTSSISDKVLPRDSNSTVDVIDERRQACGECEENRQPQSDSYGTSITLVSPCSVAVQTTVSDTDNDSCTLELSEKRNWAGGARALRDGHVRLALRALRQLRRAERLHRALLRGPAAAQKSQ